MLRTATLLACLLSLLSINAQWSDDPSINTTVRDADAAAATPLSSEAPEGGTYICWFESAATNYVLKMQLLDADGVAQWDAEGVIVSDEPQNSALFRYDLATDNEGNAVVAFQDERNGALHIVVYKVDVNGTVLWNTPVPDSSEDQGLSPSIGVLADNSLMIAWNASAGSERWVAYRPVTEDGGVTFAEPGRIGGSGVKCTRPKVIANADGGFILQYVNEVGNFPGVTSTMYAQRFDAIGTAVWTEPVQVSTRTITFFYFPEPFSDGANGFYLAFNTGNPQSASMTDVYVQRIGADGTPWSAEGTRAMDGMTTHRLTGGTVLISQADGLMVLVQVLNGSQSQSGVSVQRFSVTGERLLGANGAEVMTVSDAYHAPIGLAATTNGAILVHKSGGFGAEHISASRVLLDSSALWPNSTVLCDVNSNKGNGWVSTLRNDHVVTVWLDDRTNDGVFAQRVSSDGELDIDTSVEDEDRFASTSFMLLANTGATPILRVDQPQAARLTIEVFDARGSLIMQDQQWRGAGITEAPIALPSAAGIKTCRITTNNCVHVVRAF